MYDRRGSGLCNPWWPGSGELLGHIHVSVHVPHLVPVFLRRLSYLSWFVSMLCFIIQQVTVRPFKIGPIWICHGITCCWMGHCAVNASQGNCSKRHAPIFLSWHFPPRRFPSLLACFSFFFLCLLMAGVLTKGSVLPSLTTAFTSHKHSH